MSDSLGNVVVVGEGALALRCVDALLQRGVTPCLLASFDGSLSTVATRLAIEHLATRSTLAHRLDGVDFDHLFSVNNPWIVPGRLLSRARRCAINFHDSLLPGYAGLHATSWALMKGELTHGVTWHRMTDSLDGGPIYQQEQVSIEPDDTALSLNLKCFDAAVVAFDRLLDDLGRGTIRPRPQTGQRSYFGKRARPPAQCILDFELEAKSLKNLVQALAFGPTPNSLGVAKFRSGKTWIATRRARTLPASGAHAGTLVSFDGQSVRVATRTDDIELHDLIGLTGEIIDARILQQSVGQPLDVIEPAVRARISSLNDRVCLFEADWLDRCRSLAPLAHPYIGSTPRPGRRVELPRFCRALSAHDEDARQRESLYALFGYLYRICPDAAFDVGFQDGGFEAPVEGLFARAAPLRIEQKPEETIGEFRLALEAALSAWRKACTYALDLSLRRPGLAGQPQGLSRSLSPSLSTSSSFSPSLSLGPAHWPVAVTTGAEPGTVGALQFCFQGATPFAWVPSDLAMWQVDAIDAQLASVCDALRGDAVTPMRKISLLDEAERDKLLVQWNDTDAPLPEACVHSLFEQQSERSPRACAVSFGTTQLTYEELDARASRLANLLRARGVVRGDLVALCVDRSVEMVVGLLGILKTGAAYVPLDPTGPVDRTRAMLEQCHASAVVTRRRLREAWVTTPPIAVCFDTDYHELCAQESVFQIEPPALNERAYVIFTSGSTGVPKGVEIVHRGLVNHALAIVRNYGLNPTDRVLCAASIGFDVAAEQIYPPLISGGRVVIRPDDMYDSIRRFDAVVRQAQITSLVLPTAFWHEWVNLLAAGSLAVPPCVRLVCVGTEKASGECLTQFLKASGGQVAFLQGYGPTETTVACTMYVHAQATWDAREPIPIGRPLPNVQIYLLDADMQPVPVGMNGDIYVGGVGLARGYLHRPELTRAHFVDSPFQPGQRLYQTGDIGLYRADGQIVFVGRADFQVKIRGHRVELGEIEGVLSSHPSVAQCVVVHLDEGGDGARLVAYVVASQTTIDFDELSSLAASRLPSYMVPAAFVALDALPLTANQKIDRGALPAPARGRPKTPAAPRTDIEALIAHAWCEALELSEVGIDDDFFEMGGDSLSALNVLDDVQTRFGIALSMGDIFAAPTVARLAARLGQVRLEAPAIVALRQGQGVPLYLICGVQVYRNLARALPGTSPVFALLLPLEAAVALRGEPLPPVEELAAQYIATLRLQTPDGPYALGGLSFGGVLAFEMAVQLREAGESIALLALFDSALPRGRIDRTRLAQYGGYAKALSRRLRTGREGTRELARRVDLGLYSLSLKLRGLLGRVHVPARMAQLDLFRTGAYANALLAYDSRVRRYAGSAVLYRACERDHHRLVPGHGFAELVNEFTVFDVPGDHLGILRPPHVDVIAAHLGDLMEKALPPASLASGAE